MGKCNPQEYFRHLLARCPITNRHGDSEERAFPPPARASWRRGAPALLRCAFSAARGARFCPESPGGLAARKSAETRARAPMRTLGAERIRSHLCDSASRPIFRIRRAIDDAGLGHRSARIGGASPNRPVGARPRYRGSLRGHGNGMDLGCSSLNLQRCFFASRNSATPQPEQAVGLATYAGSRRRYRGGIRAARNVSRRKNSRLKLFASRGPDLRGLPRRRKDSNRKKLYASTVDSRKSTL